MLISVDIELMNELADLANAVCEELTEANACFTSVTTHDDWNCSERDTINDIIIHCKQFAEELREGSQSFSASIRKASDTFNEFEHRNPQALQEVHSAIERTLSVYTPVHWIMVGPGGRHPMPKPTGLFFLPNELIRKRLKTVFEPGSIQRTITVKMSPLASTALYNMGKSIKMIQWKIPSNGIPDPDFKINQSN